MTLLVISYLAGVLTVLSPCILPVLPFVFSMSGQSPAKQISLTFAGMAITFAMIGTLVATGGNWAANLNDAGRYVALAVLAVFGASLVSTRVAWLLARPAVLLGNRIANAPPPGHSGTHHSTRTPLLLGIATGLLWTPCAGPILGAILTGAALQGPNAHTTFLLLSYGAGAATVMAALLIVGRGIGQVILTRARAHLKLGVRIRQGLGVAVLAGVVVIATGWDTRVLARVSYSNTNNLEQTLLDTYYRPDDTKSSAKNMIASVTEVPGETRPPSTQSYKSILPIEGYLPSLDGAVNWLNSPPLTANQLRGKVVLVDFWTYSCINCLRTLPYVRAWADKYHDQGLVVIGVHAPEFAFEKKIGNVTRALQDLKVSYPVALDNDFNIWRAFNNHYWPALYFVDSEGRIRHHVFGEGNYDISEKVIVDLLAEANDQKPDANASLVSPKALGAEMQPNLAQLASGETYIGYRQAAGFVSRGGLSADQAKEYAPGNPGRNEWGLSGNWTVGAESAVLNQTRGGIRFRFRARDLHLVLGPGKDGKPVKFRVSVDGKAPGEDHGFDVDAQGNGTVNETRLYQLVRQSGLVRERTFDITFLDSGVEAFVFTFG
ncbi:cytochrome c biogenesis protein DipZ [Thalassospira lucentensis]|uniref:cytochrome c biogenesis protein DipZ n=1 Tax=Thalassospira lucentensis TaxID=168935 RepID=UPI00399D5D53